MRIREIKVAIKFGFRLLLSIFSVIVCSATCFTKEPPTSLIEKALASFDGIKDYSCLYIKEEKAIDNMDPQTIKLYFRKPFDVRMEWLNDKNKIDQIVVYREGYNHNKLRVKESGVLGWAGVLSIDPNGSLAGGDSKHPITEMGVGKILKRVLNEIAKGKMTVNDLGNESIEGRDAHKIEVVSDGPPGFHFAKRTILWLDTQTGFLVKHEHYDYKDQLFERHVYKDVKLNTGLGDDKFTL